MKFLILYTAIAFQAIAVYAQSYNNERVSFTNFLVRMYKNAPFEGVRIVYDYDNAYLISVLSLDCNKYKTEANMNRVASVKAMAQASRYFNGSTITQEMIIHIIEKQDGAFETEIIENLKEHSGGYIKSLEQLTNFAGQNNDRIFIFIKEIGKHKCTQS